jgi:hypothetical protein
MVLSPIDRKFRERNGIVETAALSSWMRAPYFRAQHNSHASYCFGMAEEPLFLTAGHTRNSNTGIDEQL